MTAAERLPLALAPREAVDLPEVRDLPQVGEPTPANADRAAQSDLHHPGRAGEGEISNGHAMQVTTTGARRVTRPRIHNAPIPAHRCVDSWRKLDGAGAGRIDLGRWGYLHCAGAHDAEPRGDHLPASYRLVVGIG